MESKRELKSGKIRKQCENIGKKRGPEIDAFSELLYYKPASSKPPRISLEEHLQKECKQKKGKRIGLFFP